MRGQFKDTVTVLAERDPRLVMLMGDISVFLFRSFQQKYPDRFFNVGICENTLISMTAGMSARGWHPFVHSIAPFLTERCIEQIKLDMGYNKFGGNIVTCGATFDYAWDGATHHAWVDMAAMRLIPGMEVVQPGSKTEVDALIRSQYANGKPTYFRLSDNPHAEDLSAFGPIAFGKAIVLKDVSAPVTVMTAGPILGNVRAAVAELPVNLVYFHTIKPIDRAAIERFKHTRILVVHDAHGLREAINEVYGLRTAYHGLPDEFCGWYGKVTDIRARLGLDVDGIKTAVRNFLGQN